LFGALLGDAARGSDAAMIGDRTAFRGFNRYDD